MDHCAERHGVPRRHGDVRSPFIGGDISAVKVDPAVGSNQKRRDVAARLLFSASTVRSIHVMVLELYMCTTSRDSLL